MYLETAQNLAGQDNKTRVFEIVGRTGSGKTTLAQKIALRYTENGKTVQFFQRKPEETALDIISHLLITAKRSNESEVAKSKTPDLIILDDFIFNPSDEEMYLKLMKFAEIHDCEIIIIRQTTQKDAELIAVGGLHSTCGYIVKDFLELEDMEEEQED